MGMVFENLVITTVPKYSFNTRDSGRVWHRLYFKCRDEDYPESREIHVIAWDDTAKDNKDITIGTTITIKGPQVEVSKKNNTTYISYRAKEIILPEPDEVTLEEE